jgi:hypothetical protein
MRNLLKTSVLAVLLLVPAGPASAQITIGVHIGEPPPPRVYRVPPRPGPEFVWVEGYYYPVRGQYVWHDGYWTRPPYEGAYWVEPYHIGGRYYPGRWEGRRGIVNHDHRWDRREERDERHRRGGGDRF